MVENENVVLKLAEDTKAIRNGMQTMLNAGIDLETLIILIGAKIPRSKGVGKNRIRDVLTAQKEVLKELTKLSTVTKE